MRYTTLGRTGLKVSALACGTNLFREHGRTELAGWRPVEQKQVDEAFNYALDRGANLIVTSPEYKIAESMLSKAVSHRRDEFHLAISTSAKSAEYVRTSIDNSLRIFQTDYIDIYELTVGKNTSTTRVFGRGGAMAALREARKNGKIGFVGLTGHEPEALIPFVKTGEFDTVLFIFNMAQIHALDELVPLARENQMGLLAMNPLADGALCPVRKPLRFISASPVHVAVVGMYSPAEIDENIAAFDAEPSAEEWRSLLEEVRALDTGCRGQGIWTGAICCACMPCPKEVGIPYIMSMTNYRAKYGLSPQGEHVWQACAKTTKNCDKCGECERRCPYNLSIIPIILRSAKT